MSVRLQARRITEHPVLGPDKRKTVTIYCGRKRIVARKGEPVAAALIASGMDAFRTTPRHGRPRGIYCGIGLCTDCAMIIDGKPNTRSCVTPVREGMKVSFQKGAGRLR